MQTNGNWHYRDVIPGNIATNYKIRATSVDNTNFYDEVNFAVVGLQSPLQYKIGTNSWSDMPDPLYVCKDTTVDFKAIKIPANTAWPTNKPVWGGLVSGSGMETKSYTFSTISTGATDYKIISAECGNIVTGRVVVCSVVVTNIKFNHDTESSSSDALNIRQDYDTPYDISNGEWVKGETNIPVCYKVSQSAQIKARFTVQPTDVTNADIWATAIGDGGSFGDVLMTNVTFSGGVSDYVTFQIYDTMPDCVQKTDSDVWRWKMQNINGSGSDVCNINTSGVHAVYTILTEPVSPWVNTAGNQKNAWTKALDYSCGWALSESSESGCITKITQKIYFDLSGYYDTTWGAPNYTDNGGTANFKLTTFLNAVASTNIGMVNCYDCGKSVVTFTSLLGCNALYKYSTPFGYLNCIKPIGKGWANNPFYDNPSYTNSPVTGEDDDSSNGRSSFGNHAFGSVSTNIWDACLKGNTGANPDTTNNVVETWMTGQPWDTYKTIVVDDVPYTATGSPTDYEFGLE